MAEYGEHICEVCGIGMFSHPDPDFAITTRFWSNPCCKGCGCGTYEEALTQATPEELEYIAEYGG